MSIAPKTIAQASLAEAHFLGSARLPLDPPPEPATFDFSVATIDVKNPRSLFNDSDYATLAINVLAADNTILKQYGPVVKSLGDLGKGAISHPQMALTGLSIPDGGSIAIAFVVVNKGGWSWDADAINALELAGTAVLGALAQGSIAGATTSTVAADGTVSVAPTLIPLAYVVAIAAALVGLLEGVNILFADCDGTVVPGAMTIGKTELLTLATPGPWNMTFEYPGTNSPDGCGANSDYTVTYSVEATPPPVVVPKVAVPNIKGKTIAAGVQALTTAGLVGIEKVTVFSADPKSIILGQSPGPGTQVPVHSEVQYNVEGRPQVTKPGHEPV